VKGTASEQMGMEDASLRATELLLRARTPKVLASWVVTRGRDSQTDRGEVVE
jgi:hypothetical protein